VKGFRSFWKMLRNNLGLKLISVLIAVVIWYVVIDVNDPVETTTYNVRITVVNDSYIANGKQSYRIDDAYKTVTVYVKGNRSELKDISNDDITVNADLTQIVSLDSDPVMVPLSATIPGVSATNITLSRTAIPITIEQIASKEFAVTVDTGDSMPGKDYEAGSVTPDPEQIVVNGPESIINVIDSVIARIDVTGMTQDGTREATLVLIDKNGDEISQETIEDDLTFDGGVPDVTVTVDLWKKLSGVGLNVNYSGTPEEGYHVEEINTTPETISVVGDEAVITNLINNGSEISIPAEMISVEGATQNVTAEVQLADVLPSNLRVAKNAPETVTVTIAVLSDDSKDLEVDVDDIVIENLASDLTVSYDQSNVTVVVTGSGTAFESLSGSDVDASIDLNGLTAGNYTVPLSLKLPNGVTSEKVEITVHLKEKAK